MAPLAELIRSDLQQPATAPVLTLLFGTAEPDRVAETFEAWVADQLGFAVAEAWYWRASVGAVAGLRLGNGSRVVVKAHQRHHSEAALRDIQRVQRRAWSAGLAVPQPFGGPAPLGETLATAETAVLKGRRPDLRRARDRRIVAHGLAAFIEALRSFRDDVPDLPVASAPAALYPPPHSPLFDFEATADGAAWIDELARRARAVVDQDTSVLTIVHSDWRGDNLRVARIGRRVTAVYDWDSVQVQREITAIGGVAAMHSVDWSGAKAPYYATAKECIDFGHLVVSALPRSLSGIEADALRAAILFGWCYTARCEHALASVGDDTPEFGMRERLRTDAAQLL